MISKCQGITRSYIESKWFIPSMAIPTAIMMCVGQSLIIGVVLAAVAVWLLLFSDDTLAAICPAGLIIMAATEFYDNYYALLPYAWLLVFVLAALLVHIIAYRGKFTVGRFTWSLVAVSIATIVGGIGTISVQEYFSGVSLYYVIGLGVFLLLSYMLISSRMSRKRGYDIVGRFAELLYAMALLATLLIAMYYIEHLPELWGNFYTPFISHRNFCTTVMLFGLPMPCYFVKRNHLHLVSIAVIYLMMLIGGSRSALLFGTVEIAACLVYIYRRNPQHRKVYRKIALISAIPLTIACFFIVGKVFASAGGRFGDGFIRPTEARTLFYPQAIRDFLEKPILGFGLGNMKNAYIYQGISGSIIFYHNAVLQTMASLGIVGCAAYLYQFVERVRMIIIKRHSSGALMAIAFVGVLLMSQTNPGLYCPLPTALLLVVMFAALEFDNSAAFEPCEEGEVIITGGEDDDIAIEIQETEAESEKVTA
ncbi:MAG: O-antigen ligase family protein [Clostridia bacterium]|nr:O-antigen ligase family protein [Clostridia bacterium]